MSLPEEFSQYYKKVSTTELLGILDNPGDYQPGAIEAARAELANRQLSEEEIKQARIPIIEKQERVKRIKEKQDLVTTAIKSKTNTVFETLNPIQSGTPTTEKIIRFILLILGGFYLVDLIKNFKEYLGYFKDLDFWGMYALPTLIPKLYLPLCLYLFWKKKNLGWHMLAVYCVFTIVLIAFFCVQLVDFANEPFMEYAPPMPSLLGQLVQLFFYLAILYAIGKPDLRVVYSVAEKKMVQTLAISLVLAACFLGFVQNL